MENTGRPQVQKISSPTLFGVPIIQSECQRKSFLYGITGGITCGLIAFLFTSQPRNSTRIGVGSFAVITFSFATYCLYEEYKIMKQGRLIQKAMYEASMGLEAKQKESKDSSNVKLERV